MMWNFHVDWSHVVRQYIKPSACKCLLRLCESAWEGRSFFFFFIYYSLNYFGSLFRFFVALSPRFDFLFLQVSRQSDLKNLPLALIVERLWVGVFLLSKKYNNICKKNNLLRTLGVIFSSTARRLNDKKNFNLPRFTFCAREVKAIKRFTFFTTS